MLFDEPDFDSEDEEIKSKKIRRKKLKEEKKKPSVETIVFHDRAKKRKISDVSRKILIVHNDFVFFYVESRNSNSNISRRRRI